MLSENSKVTLPVEEAIIWAQQGRMGKTHSEIGVQARPRPPRSPATGAQERPGPHWGYPSGVTLTGRPFQETLEPRHMVQCPLLREALWHTSPYFEVSEMPGQGAPSCVELQAPVSTPLEMLSALAKPSFPTWPAWGCLGQTLG